MNSGTCPKCQRKRIIESTPADYANNDLEVPMAVTANPRWMLSGRDPHSATYGQLTLYVCCDCGYTEWWTKNPSEIPIGPEYKTRIIEGKG